MLRIIKVARKVPLVGVPFLRIIHTKKREPGFNIKYIFLVIILLTVTPLFAVFQLPPFPYEYYPNNQDELVEHLKGNI